jgi:outer membrane protein assembly factor BamB
MAELARAGDFVVHGLAEDAGASASARPFLRARGLYGRASVEHLKIAPLPYPSNLVNLLVVEDYPGAVKRGLSLPDSLRVLAPGGAAVLRGARDVEGAAALDVAGGWVVLRKPWPEAMGTWTHPTGDAGGSCVSRDRLAGPPRRLKWIDEPAMYLSHFSRPEGWVSGGGRVYYAYDERHPRMTRPRRLNIVARDAFNGKLLWRRPAPVPARLRRGQPVFLGSAMVVHGDRLIAPVGENRGLLALNGATGRKLVDYKAVTARALVHRGVLLLQGRTLRAVDPDTGDLRWERPTPYCKRILAGGGRVFAYYRRRYGRPRREEWGVEAFDLKTGQPRWWAPSAEVPVRYYRERLVALTKPRYLRWPAGRTLAVLDAKTGKRLWDRKTQQRYVYAMHERVWQPAVWEDARGERTFGWLGLDVETGEERRRVSGYVKGAITHHWIRCSGTNATLRYFITGNTMDFLDVKTGEHSRSMAARSSCRAGVQIANGMVYTFPVDCGCFRSLRGVLGMAPEDRPAPDDRPTLRVRGPAYGDESDAAAGEGGAEDDWPCYRHDPARSGASVAKLPDALTLLWRAEVGGSPTAPVVAGGTAFVASKDKCRLVALDAATGKKRWEFTPGGPLDTPPTCDHGAVLFGCRDGWVYCLVAADGRLVWRTRMAPEERRIIACGRIESPVPVYGSVLVINGVLYGSAGYTSELDGGVRVCALEVRTGKPLWHRVIGRSRLEPGKRLDKWTLPRVGALGDILRSDGEYVYLRDWRLGLKTGEPKQSSRWIIGPTPSSKAGFLDRSLKQLWVHRGVSGQMVVSGRNTTCGFLALEKEGWRLGYFTGPGEGRYRIFGRHFDQAGRPDEARPGWTIEGAAVAVEAMAIAGDKLLAAGPPDAAEPKGGLLWLVSLAEGKRLQEIRLGAAPVFDGLAAAVGRLYVAAKDGTLSCYGARQAVGRGI